MNIYGNKVVNVNARLGLGSLFKHASKGAATFINFQQPENRPSGHQISIGFLDNLSWLCTMNFMAIELLL